MRIFKLLLVLGPISAFAQVDTTKLIDQLFANYNNATPGVSILVAPGSADPFPNNSLPLLF